MVSYILLFIGVVFCTASIIFSEGYIEITGFLIGCLLFIFGSAIKNKEVEEKYD